MKPMPQIPLSKKQTTVQQKMIFLMIIGYLLAAPNDLINRCQKYGISINDCLNSIYLPRMEYDKYLQSFNLPIVRDEACDKATCTVVVYNNPSNCTRCVHGDCLRSCTGIMNAIENPVIVEKSMNTIPELVPRMIDISSPVHVVHHQVLNQESSPDIKLEKSEQPVILKNPVIIETKERINAGDSTYSSAKNEDKKEEVGNDTNSRISAREVRMKKKDVPLEESCHDVDEDKRHSTSAKSTMQKKRKKIDMSEESEDECSEMEGRKENVEPDVVTVTTVSYKIKTVEKPITLYREFTTTIKEEVPIINYKVTTVKEVVTHTETSVVPKTITTTQTLYSVYVPKRKEDVKMDVVGNDEIPASVERSLINEDTPIPMCDERMVFVEDREKVKSNPSRMWAKPETPTLGLTKTQDREMSGREASNELTETILKECLKSMLNPDGTKASNSISRLEKAPEKCKDSCFEKSCVETSECAEKKGQIDSKNRGAIKAPFTETTNSIPADKKPSDSVEKQHITEEIVPLIRNILLGDPQALSHESKNEEGSRKTVTRFVMKTTTRKTRNKRNKKTVYNTIYSRKGMRGKKERMREKKEKKS